MDRRQLLKQAGTLAAANLLPRATSLLAQPPMTYPSEAPAIHLNQLGYLPIAPKIATAANLPPDTPQTFRILNGAATEVLTGTLTASQQDEASGDQTCLADFSSLTAPGTYTLAIGTFVSDPFTIAPDVYRRALYLATRAFYGQRCGCKVDLGDGYQHPICHTDAEYHPTSGRTGKPKHHAGHHEAGGWHDAGDYGRYVVNSGISTATLLYAFDLYPDTLRNFKLDIPPHHRHLPDILAEVRWNLDWMISLQDRDGGVWHKQTSAQFCGFIMPQDDKLTSYIIGTGVSPYKSTCATAGLAAVMAIATRLFRDFDHRYAVHCLQVARNAWSWAVDNPELPFVNPQGIGTGGYDDPHLSDELLWASAELFRATGEPQYESQFLASFSPGAARLDIPAPSWGNLFALGCYAYAVSPSASPVIQSLIHTAFAHAADELIHASAANGYANTLHTRDYGWGSNAIAANHSFLLLLADRLNPDRTCRDVALNNLHYLLGRNCHGVSWVTHLGARPFLHPHHRPSAADGILEPWPGLLSGGPNRHPSDDAARNLPKMPPMRMWIDDVRAYSLNEIAINWNAPLVFLLAAANSAT